MQPLAVHEGTTPARWVLLVLLSALLLSTQPVRAADLAVSEVTDMDFGTVVDSNGVVTLGLLDDISADPFDIHVGDPVRSGEFLITGDPFATFSLIIAGSTTNGLTLQSFETDAGTPPLLNVALDGTGQILLRVGAELIVSGANAEPGFDQKLFFTLTLDYN